MPYEIREDDGKFCVYTKGSDEEHGCHDTREEAVQQQRALYASEKKAVDNLAKAIVRRFESLTKRKRFTLGQDGTGFKTKGNHWFATWTNNFEDREGEIFSSKAIEEYVARVEGGLVPYPELWVWHGGAKTRIGAADMVGTVGHFGVASGTFDDTPHARKAAAYYQKNAGMTTLSHGFTYPTYALKDGVYSKFNTFEISLLERGAEANLFTSLEGVKMALNEKQRGYLVKVFGDEFVNGLESDLDERGKAIEAIGVAYKDNADVPQTGGDDEDEEDTINIPTTDLIKAVLTLTGDNAALTAAIAQKAKADGDTTSALATQVAALQAQVKALDERLNDRPRVATKDDATVINDTEIPQAVREPSATARFFGLGN
jgi:hypothetical protein